MSLYDDLGVPADADAETISRAYRHRAKTEHPDAGGDPEKFAHLSRAVSILRDPQRRAEYDRTGNTEESGITPEGEAIQMLSVAFQEAVQANMQQPLMAAQVDMIKNTVANLNAKMNNVRANRSVCSQSMTVAEKLLARLTKKSDGPNVLAKMLADQIAAHAESLKQMDHMEKIIKDALALAEDYTWQTDVVPQPMMSSAWTNTVWR